MNIVVFGLSISSAWGNGHATLLRGLFRALYGNGHTVHFFEHDAPYYAAHRDAPTLPYANLHLYAEWSDVLPQARAVLADADVAMVTSYCPHGIAASELVLQSRPSLRKLFYDMDTPVTLSRLHNGESVPYLPVSGLGGFDLVLSYTGGVALRKLQSELGAQRVAPLYGWVDPQSHWQVPPSAAFSGDLSYLGTYAADRQQALSEMLIEPARRMPNRSFLIAGAMFPGTDSWPTNIRYFSHLSPPEHSAFYSSSPLTLNVTRGAMAAMGYCPSGRLFEAAACGTAVLSDWWEGIDTFFEPDTEILIATSTTEAADLIATDRGVLKAIGSRARQRALDCHTAEIRARALTEMIEDPDNATEKDGSMDDSAQVLAGNDA